MNIPTPGDCSHRERYCLPMPSLRGLTIICSDVNVAFGCTVLGQGARRYEAYSEFTLLSEARCNK